MFAFTTLWVLNGLFQRHDFIHDVTWIWQLLPFTKQMFLNGQLKLTLQHVEKTIRIHLHDCNFTSHHSNNNSYSSLFTQRSQNNLQMTYYQNWLKDGRSVSGKLSRSENIFYFCIGTTPKSFEIFSQKKISTETTVSCPKGSGSNFSSLRKACIARRKLDQNQYMQHLDFNENALVENIPISSECWPILQMGNMERQW